MKALYDASALDRVAWAALRAPSTTFEVLYNEGCQPPMFPPLVANVSLAPVDWVPAGCITVTMSDRPVGEMVHATRVSFTSTSAVVEYQDTRLGGITGAVAIPAGDERYADEIEVLRAHAGILAAQVIAERS